MTLSKPTPNTHILVPTIVALLALFCCASSARARSPKDCLKEYKAGRYVEAAECFSKMIKGEGKTPAKRAMWLWNTALTYRAAATKEANPEKQLYLRTRALAYFQQFRKGGHARTEKQKQLAQKVSLGLTNQIGKTTLHIKCDDNNALIKVTQKRYIRTIKGAWSKVEVQIPGLGRGQWREQVLPGTFTVTVTHPPAKIVTQTVIVKPNVPESIQITKPEPRAAVPARRRPVPRRAVVRRPPPRRVVRPRPPPRPSPRVVAAQRVKLVLWNPVKPPSRASTMVTGLLVGSGIAVMLGGGAAMLMNIDLASLITELKTVKLTKEEGEKLDKFIGAEETRNYIIGASLLTVGVLLIALGITNYALSHTSAAPPGVASQQPPAPAQSRRANFRIEFSH